MHHLKYFKTTVSFITIKKIGECGFWNLIISICKFICKFMVTIIATKIILNFNFKLTLEHILIVKCLINNLYTICKKNCISSILYKTSYCFFKTVLLLFYKKPWFLILRHYVWLNCVDTMCLFQKSKRHTLHIFIWKPL